MKLNRTRKRIIIAALFFMVAMMETGWVGVIYRKESQTFGKEMERIITDAIVNEEWNHQHNPYPGYSIHKKDRLILAYDIDGKHFKVDTVSGIYTIDKSMTLPGRNGR